MSRRKFVSKSPTLIFLAAGGLLFAAFLCGLAVSASQDPDSRPRRSIPTAAAQPTPTPTPRTGTDSAPRTDTQRSVGQPASPATPTGTPVPRPTPAGQLVPTLGEPPPPPVLRPKPSPTPEAGEELDPESVVKVNTELVTLNVRVIDRNNRPIDNVKQSEFRVFEDGSQNFARRAARKKQGRAGKRISGGNFITSMGTRRRSTSSILIMLIGAVRVAATALTGFTRRVGEGISCCLTRLEWHLSRAPLKAIVIFIVTSGWEPRGKEVSSSTTARSTSLMARNTERNLSD